MGVPFFLLLFSVNLCVSSVISVVKTNRPALPHLIFFLRWHVIFYSSSGEADAVRRVYPVAGIYSRKRSVLQKHRTATCQQNGYDTGATDRLY